jgi:hypothetical protein
MIKYKKYRIKSLYDNIKMDNPARLGIVANLYSQYTALHLTEALMNVWTKGVGKGGFKSIDNFMVE